MTHYESVKETLFNYLRDHIRYGLTAEEVKQMLEELKREICESV